MSGLKPTVEVTIETNGEITVGTKNVAGPDCVKLSEAIEESLGAKTEDVRTADYHKAAHGMHGQQAKQGG